MRERLATVYQHADDGYQRRPGIESEQTDGYGHRQFEKIGGADKAGGR